VTTQPILTPLDVLVVDRLDAPRDDRPSSGVPPRRQLSCDYRPSIFTVAVLTDGLPDGVDDVNSREKPHDKPTNTPTGEDGPLGVSSLRVDPVGAWRMSLPADTITISTGPYRTCMDEEGAPEGDTHHTVTTEEAFQEALRALVLEADANGVSVRGGWPVARDDGTREWDIEITVVSRPTTAHVDDTGSPVASVVEAVAAREGVETTDLPPLQDAIGHEVLEALLDTSDDGSPQHLRFRYSGYEITVRSDGSIRLEG